MKSPITILEMQIPFPSHFNDLQFDSRTLSEINWLTSFGDMFDKNEEHSTESMNSVDDKVIK